VRVTGLVVVSTGWGKLLDAIGRAIVRDFALAALRSMVGDSTRPDNMMIEKLKQVFLHLARSCRFRLRMLAHLLKYSQ
jgi:hypothetical protein